MQGCVDSQESLTGGDRPELSGTIKEVTERNNTDHILDRLINWQYLLPPIKLFYIISRPQKPILTHLLESYHVPPCKQAIADLNDPLPVKRLQLIFRMSCVNAANNCIPRCLWHS